MVYFQNLNVHGLFLDDAVEEIWIKFDECIELGDFSLEIIHGYKHGTIIKDYIRSNGFLQKAARNGYEIVSKNFSDKGVTIFQIKSSKKRSITNPIPKSISIGITSEKNMQTKCCLKCKVPLIIIKESNWYKCPMCGKFKKR